ncbi:hypothetical protein [Agromyces mangrovi Wang et al. 2018]|uniref:hypothetical protein n=1 Tax=Agromyces mangrovi TaxID=1858653 RepID=UPI00257273B5|nr:hypothetical protein [Agromyces mangrovi]
MVPDDAHWRDWVMFALTAASEVWGGVAFIVVPFDSSSGTPLPLFHDIVRAYDPDHVVTLELSLQAWEDLYPGHIKIEGAEDEESRLRLIRSAGIFHADLAAERARAQVAQWCSPLRAARLRRKSEDLEVLRRIRLERGDRVETGALAPAPQPAGAVLAAARHWRSDEALMAAMRVGIATTEPDPRPEPPGELLPWLVYSEQDNEHAEALKWGEGELGESPERWFTSNQRLMQVTRGMNFDAYAMVVGNTLSDYALALAYDRLMGQAMWLSTELAEDKDRLRRQVAPRVQTVLTRLESGAQHLVLTSASESDELLKALAESLQRSDLEVYFESNGQRVLLKDDQDTLQVRRPDLSTGLVSFVLDEHVGAEVSLPMATTSDGSLEAMIGLETPVPVNLIFSSSSGHIPYWYVDATLEHDRIPRGRDVPASALVVDDGPYPQVNLRSSRDGVSFSPRSMGFVPSNALFASRIGRPRLRRPSMLAWVEAMARVNGLGVRLSDAGRRAELVRSRIGSRQDLLDLMTPDHLAMFRSFAPRPRRPGPGERDPDVVVVGLDPYLTFAGIRSQLSGLGTTECLDLVDRLVASRLLRRGLVLGCEECARPSFLGAERLGQQYECPQCGATNSLVSSRWRRQSAEPTWFYDLYSNLRELVDKNGDVVLMAADHLRAGARAYADVPELEFLDQESGKPVAEIDVVACVDGDVVVVEAKSKGSFGSRRRKPQSSKLMRVATALRAQRILLATTADAWSETDVELFRDVSSQTGPASVEISVVAGLGSPTSSPPLS